MQVGIVGCGHVGLVYALAFAEKGHRVWCSDVKAETIERLQRAEPTFHEPQLPELLKKHVQAGNVSFTTSTADVVAHAQVVFICVSTPSLEDGRVDMRYFENASRDIARALSKDKGFRLIVTKSTVPVGATRHLRRNMLRYSPEGAEFDVASNPEFLAEGTAFRDTLTPSRIVMGTASEKARTLLHEVYSPFDVPKVSTEIESAELIKLSSNAHLAMRISFVNALSRICELSGARIEDVARGMGLDPRIGPHYLKAGIGFGGSCFTKDVAGLHQEAARIGYDFPLLAQVNAINEAQWLHTVDRIEADLWSVAGKRIALWGASFKPGTDDLRDSPAIKIAQELLRRGAQVVCYDPVATRKAVALVSGMQEAASALDAVNGADALILATEWPEFLKLDPREVANRMAVSYVYDGRISLNAEAWQAAGFEFRRTGWK